MFFNGKISKFVIQIPFVGDSRWILGNSSIEFFRKLKNILWFIGSSIRIPIFLETAIYLLIQWIIHHWSIRIPSDEYWSFWIFYGWLIHKMMFSRDPNQLSEREWERDQYRVRRVVLFIVCNTHRVDFYCLSFSFDFKPAFIVVFLVWEFGKTHRQPTFRQSRGRNRRSWEYKKSHQWIATVLKIISSHVW